jgi:hypothetical protein
LSGKSQEQISIEMTAFTASTGPLAPLALGIESPFLAGPFALRKINKLIKAETNPKVDNRLEAGGQPTKLVEEAPDCVPPRRHVSGDPSALRNIVRDAKAGNTTKQGELEVIKELRARGQNVHAIDETSKFRKSEGTYNDILYGGDRP